MDTPDESARFRSITPKALNAHSHVLLTTGLHPGPRHKFCSSPDIYRPLFLTHLPSAK